MCATVTEALSNYRIHGIKMCKVALDPDSCVDCSKVRRFQCSFSFNFSFSWYNFKIRLHTIKFNQTNTVGLTFNCRKEIKHFTQHLGIVPLSAFFKTKKILFCTKIMIASQRSLNKFWSPAFNKIVWHSRY